MLDLIRLFSCMDTYETCFVHLFTRSTTNASAYASRSSQIKDQSILTRHILDYDSKLYK